MPSSITVVKSTAKVGAGSVAKELAVAVGASIFMAACAHVTVPLAFSPVPLTMQPFGVLILALVLGSRRSAAALALYILEGVAGLPVFSPAGPGGLLQLLGPTGGYLMAYPFAAFAAGWIYERGKSAINAVAACICAEVIFLSAGMLWLAAVTHVTLGRAMVLAMIPYIPGEILKTFAAVTLAQRWNKLTAVAIPK